MGAPKCVYGGGQAPPVSGQVSCQAPVFPCEGSRPLLVCGRGCPAQGGVLRISTVVSSVSSGCPEVSGCSLACPWVLQLHTFLWSISLPVLGFGSSVLQRCLYHSVFLLQAKYKERGTVLAEDQLAQVGDPPLLRYNRVCEPSCESRLRLTLFQGWSIIHKQCGERWHPPGCFSSKNCAVSCRCCPASMLSILATSHFCRAVSLPFESPGGGQHV